MNSAAESAPSPRYNLWLFIPLLYFLQAVPVTLVQEVATIIFKDLGIDNEPITRWTSLIALPWSLQMLLGPFVDLNFSKRWWILSGQAIIAIGLATAAYVLRTPYAFEFGLVVLGITAIFSALCNIATDGFVILATNQTEQARFAGIMSTCYRLGRLFCAAALVFIAGLMMKLPPLHLGNLNGPYLASDGRPVTDVDLVVDSGRLVDRNGARLNASLNPGDVIVPPGTFRLEVRANGDVAATTLKETKVVGSIPIEPGKTSIGPPSTCRNPREAWVIVMAIAAAVYVLGHFVTRRVAPKPVEDRVKDAPPGETTLNLYRTLALLAIGVGGYFAMNALVRLGAHAIWAIWDGSRATGPEISGFQGWALPNDNKIPLFNNLSFGGVGTEVFQFALSAAIAAFGAIVARKMIRGSSMGVALGTFVQQPGFRAIFFFILFYRLPEAMVGKISPLFLKDSIEKGGLAIANDQLGILNGLLGVVGIILGGIVGGLVVSKVGLKRAFLPIALAMHIPNLLYLGLSLHKIPINTVQLAWPGPLSPALGAILFIDQFGYGFGFAGYMVYLMWVAKRGDFATSHYAIGTGMGALCIAVAGVISGTVQHNFGYFGVFVAVMFLSIPGLASLFFIPLDDTHRDIQAAVE